MRRKLAGSLGTRSRTVVADNSVDVVVVAVAVVVVVVVAAAVCEKSLLHITTLIAKVCQHGEKEI